METQDISLAICGHAWHGKSTLLGKVVAESGMATQREIEAARKAAGEGRDASLVFAQLVFRSKDVNHTGSEAARGVTILPSMVRFEFPDHRVTVIDTPGQETYANNRFFGMFQADCAMLVVDCKDGIMPITEQVMRIFKGFEIPVHAVAVTKMDTVDYDESEFRLRCDEVREAFDTYGIEHDNVAFIPTSSYAPARDIHEPGEGITSFQKMTWFEGPTVRDFLRELSFEKIRPANGPVRLVIHGSEVYDNVPGIGKTCTALIESGTVKPDQTLRFEPISAERKKLVTARVRSIQLTKGHIATPGVPIDKGVPRQLVGVALRNLSDKDSLRELFKGRGVVAGTLDSPPRIARKMMVELTVFHPDTMLTTGAQWTMHVHVDRCPVQIDKIHAKRPVESSEWQPVDDDDPLVMGEWGQLEFSIVTRPLAVEEAAVCAPLSKFVLRKENKAVAYGRVVQILE